MHIKKLIIFAGIQIKNQLIVIAIDNDRDVIMQTQVKLCGSSGKQRISWEIYEQFLCCNFLIIVADAQLRQNAIFRTAIISTFYLLLCAISLFRNNRTCTKLSPILVFIIAWWMTSHEARQSIAFYLIAFFLYIEKLPF